MTRKQSEATPAKELGVTQLTDSDADLSGVTPVRALHLLTTDLLLAELVSGRPIATDVSGCLLILGKTLPSLRRRFA
jgi:hypothetical protein